MENFSNQKFSSETLSNNAKSNWGSKTSLSLPPVRIRKNRKEKQEMKISQKFQETIETSLRISIPSAETLNIEEFMPRKKESKKTCNAFLIYRKLYLGELKKFGYRQKMVVASKLIAKSWEEESESYKNSFRFFANKVHETFTFRRLEEQKKKNSKQDFIHFDPIQEVSLLNRPDNRASENILQTSLNFNFPSPEEHYTTEMVTNLTFQPVISNMIEPLTFSSSEIWNDHAAWMYP
ncbi:hypothetical protein G9A89_014008 [Geosiphon pyriformis]|nr:hypothetical protein G9A89_014008 [Geosiphon pyriformis]